MNIRVFSLVKKEEFQNCITRDLTYTEGVAPNVNQYIWNDNGKYVHANCNRGYFRIALGEIGIGDKIKVQAEIMCVSGIKPHFSIDYSNQSYVGTNFDTSGLESINSSGVWETITFNFISKNNSKYTSCVIGLSQGEIGEYKLRNVVITVDSKYSNSDIYSNSSIIRYDNGLMEINMTQRLNNVEIKGAWGQIFGSETYNLSNYPVEFTEPPTVQVSVFNTEDWSFMSSLKSLPTKTSPGKIIFFRGTATTTPLSFDIHIRAIGRWNKYGY